MGPMCALWSYGGSIHGRSETPVNLWEYVAMPNIDPVVKAWELDLAARLGQAVQVHQLGAHAVACVSVVKAASASRVKR